MAELNRNMSSLMDQMNYNYSIKQTNREQVRTIVQSLLPQIELAILDIVKKVQANGTLPREVEEYLAINMVFSPDVMDEPERYKGFEELGVEKVAVEVLGSAQSYQTPKSMNLVDGNRSR